MSALVQGIPLSTRTFDETVELLVTWAKGGGARQIATANLDFLRLAARDAELREALQQADLVTCDGAPVAWLAGRQAEVPVPRVTGSDLAPALARRAAEEGMRLYLLGGQGDVALRAARVLRRAHPGLDIVGAEGPQIDLSDDAACRRVATRVAESSADIVLVALGCPKQDKFIARYRNSMRARIAMGVGTSFDFIAGTKRRAPTWMQRLRMEWAFRLAQEPRRLGARYLHDAIHLARLVMNPHLAQRVPE